MTLSTIQELPNRIDSTAEPLVYGSGTGVDANDPIAPEHNGEHYVYFPESNDNGVYSDAFATPTADFTVIWDGVLDDLTGAARQGLACQYITVGNQRAWSLTVAASGVITVYLSPDGTASSFGSGTTNLSTAATAGERFQLKAAFDFDAGGATITITTSTDSGATFDAFDSIAIGAYTDTEVYQASIPMNIGARYATGSTGTGAREVLGGIVHSVTIEGVKQFDPADGIDATTDPDAGQTTWTSGGRTWTVQRGTSGLVTAVVTQSIMGVLDGTSGYLQAPAELVPTFTATTGQYTVVVKFRRHNANSSGIDRMFSTESAASDGLLLALDASDNINARVGGDLLFRDTAGGAHTPGALTVAAAIVDNGTLAVYDNTNGLSATKDITDVGTITHASPRAGATAYAVAALTEGEMYSVLIFADEALTEAQLDTLSAKMLAADYN